MEIQAVAGIRLDISLEIGGGDVGEVPRDGRGDRGQARVSGGEAVPAAEGHVVGAGEDQDGPGVGVDLGRAVEREELADGDGLFGAFARVEDAGVEMAGQEEVVLGRVDVFVREVPVAVLDFGQTGSDPCQVVGEPVCAAQEFLLGGGDFQDGSQSAEDGFAGGERRVAEAERLVELREHEVGACGEQGHERGVRGETRQHDPVGDGWVQVD